MTWANVLLSEVFNRLSSLFRVLCNRPSSFFRCNAQHPPMPLSAWSMLPPQYRHLVVKSGTTAGQHDTSSAHGSDWCFVRCTPPPMPPQCPQVEASGGQECYLGPIDPSSCSIVCSVQWTVLSFQEYLAIDHFHFSDVTPMPPFGPLNDPTPSLGF